MKGFIEVRVDNSNHLVNVRHIITIEELPGQCKIHTKGMYIITNETYNEVFESIESSLSE